MATVATLFVVPVVYATLRVKLAEQARDGAEVLGRGARGTRRARPLREPRLMSSARRSSRTTRYHPRPRMRTAAVRRRHGSPRARLSARRRRRGGHRPRRRRARERTAPARRARRRGAVADVRLGPRVRVATVKQAPGVRHLALQGEARPFFEVTLYAKVAGFLSDLKVDKGDRVKKNQLIATVTAPELDSQYVAAVADARNKRVNAKRLSALAPAGVVSAQELELGQATADVADATQATLGHPARLPRDPRAVRRRRQRALRRSGDADPERRQRPERRRADRLGLQGGPAARLRLRRPVERAVRSRRRHRHRHASPSGRAGRARPRSPARAASCRPRRAPC